MNLGVDVFGQHVTPPRPSMGLRLGGERPDIEALLPALYAAFYDSVAAHARHGLNVVADVGHHDAYSAPLHLLRDAAERLCGLPAFFVDDLEIDTSTVTPEAAAAAIQARLAASPPTAFSTLAAHPAPD